MADNNAPAAADTAAELPTIADDLVVTKYKMAAEIVNRESTCPLSRFDSLKFFAVTYAASISSRKMALKL